jgi:hypothetical protein
MSSLDATPRERAANIFINYRREDTAGHSGRLFDSLSSHFAGRLFMDVDTLEAGVDFVEAIERAVGSCEALIVVIGREWLTVTDKAGRRRLDDPGDFVRLEVESALARRIRVIPVLVQDAPMPGAEELPPSLARLARRNAIELSDARWAYDADRLAHVIREILEENPAPPLPTPAAPAVVAKAPRPRAWLLSLAALGLVAAGVLVSGAWRGETPSRPSPAQPLLVQPAPVRPADPGAVAASGGVPAPVAPQVPARVEPVANPTAAVDDPARTVAVRPLRPHDREPLRPSETSTAPRVAPEAAETTIRVAPVAAAPVAIAREKEKEETIPSAQPVRATILSPRNGETVGSDVLVQGIVTGLGDRQVFLGIRQGNGAIYPRGELILDADGQWSIKLRSSKEKTFDILVVAASGKEATQVLRDQRSRDNGLLTLPPGAAVSSRVVTLKKQGRLFGLLRPKTAGADP